MYLRSVSASSAAERTLPARLLSCALEHSVQHVVRHAAGKGVLLTRVVATNEQRLAAAAPLGRRREPDLRAMPERRPRPGQADAREAQLRPDGLPGEVTQADDDAGGRANQVELGRQPWRAGIPLVD